MSSALAHLGGYCFMTEVLLDETTTMSKMVRHVMITAGWIRELKVEECLIIKRMAAVHEYPRYFYSINRIYFY